MANPLKMLKLKTYAFQFIQELKIDAPPNRVWDSLLNVGGWFKFDTNAPSFGRKLELHPGGRFFNEMPDGSMALHAIVTYVEPGKLLRLNGQMGMTHVPVNSVFIFELNDRKGGGTLLRFCQRSFGYMDKDVAKRMKSGWGKLLPNLKALAESRGPRGRKAPKLLKV